MSEGELQSSCGRWQRKASSRVAAVAAHQEGGWMSRGCTCAPKQSSRLGPMQSSPRAAHPTAGRPAGSSMSPIMGWMQDFRRRGRQVGGSHLEARQKLSVPGPKGEQASLRPPEAAHQPSAAGLPAPLPALALPSRYSKYLCWPEYNALRIPTGPVCGCQ